MKKKKKRLFGMHSLLAVIALMLAASIYASCSSDDDDYDNGWVELETMAKGTRAASGESATKDSIHTVFVTIGGYSVIAGSTTFRAHVHRDSIMIPIRFEWDGENVELIQMKYEVIKDSIESQICNKDSVLVESVTLYGFLEDKLSMGIYYYWGKDKHWHFEYRYDIFDMSEYLIRNTP